MMTCIIASCQRNVGAGIDRQVPIGVPRGAGPVGIYDNQLRAVAAGLFDERPQMNVGAVMFAPHAMMYFEWRKASMSVPRLAAEHSD